MEGRPVRPGGPEPGGPYLCRSGGRRGRGSAEGGPGVPVSDPGTGPPDLFANTPEERFLERKAAIETGLEEADDFTFALELQSLTALAGDSHTTLALGGSMSQTVHYYPMSLLHRDGSWYLSAVPAEHRALLGREITAVNGRSMEEIVEAFAAQVERDLSAGEYRRVVVDLRNNGGGSDGVIWPLLRVLRQAMDRGMEGVEPLEPDVTVPQTMADTLAGRDTAVERLAALAG